MKIKKMDRWVVATVLGSFAMSAWAALPTEGTYAVLTTKDFNADSLYANTLSGDAKTAVTSDPDYNKGFFGSSLTTASKINRWTVYRNGVADPSATDAFPPNANYDYWLTSGNTLTTPNGGGDSSGTYAFPGRSLTLSSGDIQHCSKGTTVVDLGTDVRIQGKWNSYGFPARSKADPQTRAQMTMAENAELSITAATPDEGPYGLDWKIVAPASATIRLANSNSAKGRWHWWGDCSGFRGTLFAGVNAMNDAAYGMTFVLDADFAGTISLDKWNRFTVGEKVGTLGALEVKDEGVLSLEAGKTVRVGSLDLKAGAVIEVKDLASGEVVAETALSVAGPVRVRLPAGSLDRGVLTVPAASAISASDFAFGATTDGVPLSLAVCDVRDNGNGTKTLWIKAATSSKGLGSTLEVDRQVALDQADPLVQVRVKAGGTLTYGASSEAAARMPVYVESGAVVNLEAPVAAWSTIPLLWLDASAANTISNIVVTYDNSYVNYDSSRKLVVGQTICDTEGNPFVKGWFDCRNAPAPVKMWNDRYDALYNANHNVMSACHPRRIRGGLNGLDYLSFDRPNPSFVATFEGAGASETVSPLSTILPRIYFASIDSPVTAGYTYAMRPRYAFLVYGSQQGGGAALLAGNANFLRAGTAGAHTKDDAIFASNAAGAQVWVDGTEVDPTKTGLNGAWQVITVDFKSTGNAFTGLGYGVKNNEDNGGQAYAEVLFVTQELSERQRQSIEIYLAEKWGLADQYAYPAWAATKAAVYGAGTLNVRSDATLSGGFAGTIDVQGKTLTIAGSALPPTDAVIDSTDMTGWFDPGWEGALEMKKSTTANPKSPEERVMWLYDRRCGATAKEGFYALTATTVTRGPWVDASAHGLGPVRNWLDYSNVEYQPWPGTEDNRIFNGDTLRFRVAQNNKWGGDVVSNAFQTLVMVQDSKYGGGQPFVDGNSVLPSAAATLYKTRQQKTADSPIYPAGTSAILTGGTTRLDGEPVDGSTQGFHGRPEILSVQPNGDYAPVCFEWLSDNERLYGSTTRAAVQGEILMWNRKLAESELKTVEAYLSWKWLGVLPTGYVSLTNATLTGSGTIRAESVRLLPKFAPSAQFAVEVVEKDRLSFTVSGEGVADSLDLGASTLNLAASCAVELVLDGKPHAGDFALLTCGGGLEKTTFTLTPNVWQGRKLQLARTATTLTLHVPDSGCVLIFR